MSFGSLNANEGITKTDYIYNVDPIDAIQVVAGNTYEIRGYIVNTQKRHEVQGNNVLANTIPMVLKYSVNRDIISFANATEVTYYRDRKLYEGSNFYRYSDATGPAYTGYYIYNFDGLTYYYYYVVDGVYMGASQYAPRTKQEYFGRGSTYQMAVDDAISHSWTYISSIWYDGGNNTWYADEFLNTLALDGYYILSDSPDPIYEGYENYHIVNGTNIGSYPEQ